MYAREFSTSVIVCITAIISSSATQHHDGHRQHCRRRRRCRQRSPHLSSSPRACFPLCNPHPYLSKTKCVFQEPPAAQPRRRRAPDEDPAVRAAVAMLRPARKAAARGGAAKPKALGKEPVGGASGGHAAGDHAAGEREGDDDASASSEEDEAGLHPEEREEW